MTAHNHHSKSETHQETSKQEAAISSAQQSNHHRGKTDTRPSNDQRLFQFLQLRSPGGHVQRLPVRVHARGSPMLLHAEPIVSLGGLLARSFRLEMKDNSVSLESAEFANSEPSQLSSTVGTSSPPNLHSENITHFSVSKDTREMQSS